MDLRIGGEIDFDDGEGTTYIGTITELERQPYLVSAKLMMGLAFHCRKRIKVV